MKKTILISLALLAIMIAVAQKATFSRAPRGLLVPATHGKMELYNTGTAPLYYHGFTRNDTIFKIDIAPFRPRPSSQEEICGDGLILHRLDPGDSVLLRVYLPHAAYEGREIVVGCNLFGTLSGWEKFKEKLRKKWPDSFEEPYPPDSNRPIVKLKTDKYIPRKG